MDKLKDLIQELKDKATDYAVKYQNANTPRQRYIISEKDKKLVDKYYPKIKALHTVDQEEIEEIIVPNYPFIPKKYVQGIAREITKYIDTKGNDEEA